jgi:hypothetical protein
MALSDIEVARFRTELSTFIERRRPPVHIRSQVDLCYRISGQSVELFEVRPRFMDPSEKHEIPVAKATYVRTQEHWRVYWMRSDLKWHRYGPDPEVSRLAEFLDLVDRDEYACFFG